MTNTSATGGYLQPNPPPAPAPLEGQNLLDFLQEVLVGVTGLNGTMVRPRWQSDPPNIPNAGDAWCAFGITSRPSDTFAYVGHITNQANPQGADAMQRQETLHLLASFYDQGSSGLADEYAALLRDGFQIAQNREVLQRNGFAFVSSGELETVPSLLKERWLYRVDIALTIRRQIDRTYPVLNLDSAQIEVVAQSGDQTPLTADIVVEQET